MLILFLIGAHFPKIDAHFSKIGAHLPKIDDYFLICWPFQFGISDREPVASLTVTCKQHDHEHTAMMTPKGKAVCINVCGTTGTYNLTDIIIN